MSDEELAVVVNHAAAEVAKKLNAYGVVVMALIASEDGSEMLMPTGLFGSAPAAKYIGERMHGIGEMMVKASAAPPQKGEMYTDVSYIGRTPPLGNG